MTEPLPTPSESPAVARSPDPLVPLLDGLRGFMWRRGWLIGLVLAALLVLCLALAYEADRRVRSVERELVKRQQESEGKSSEATMVAKQAQDSMRDAAAKVALFEARLNEVTTQRGQLEELIQSLARSRDQNLVVDIEAALRVAQQQAALTGSAEPLVATLKQSDERLARLNQPRLEPTRRAIARDLDRVKAMSLVDVPSLVIKLDESLRMVDDLPLLSQAEPRHGEAVNPSGGAVRGVAPSQSAASASASDNFGTRAASSAWDFFVDHVWHEARSLVRVTRIDRPEAMLLAPDQAYFLKENLKLRLLNARLAILSRQFDTAQGDLQQAQQSMARYFDPTSRRTQLAAELLRQVSQQARQVGVPRPDDTLTALAAAGAAR